MDLVHQLVTIFCEIDDFCKELDDQFKKTWLTRSMHSGKTRGPDCSLTSSEIATILIMFQMM